MRYKNWKQLIGGRLGLIVIGALIIFIIISVLHEILDLPHLLLGAPRTPINLAEFIIDLIAAFFIGLIAISLIRRAESKQKKVEMALRESEKKYRQLIENAQEGIWAIDKDTYTTFVNPRMAEILRYTVDEMQGKHLFSFMDEQGIKICKRNLERRKQGIKEQHDFEFVRKDGTRVYTSLETSPITDDDGNYIGALAFVTDITERKKAEEELRESEKKYRTLYETIRDGIAGGPMDGGIFECNQAFAEMLGYSKDELKNLTYQQLTPKRWHQMEAKIVKEQILKRGYSDEYKKEYIRKDGTVFPVSARVWLIRDEDGKPEGMWGVVRDITERKRAEEALRFQSEIAANMSEGVYLIRASDGVIVYTNPKFEEIFGYGPGGMIGKHVSIVNAPTEKSPEETAKEIMEFINKHGFWRGEINNIKKDGTPFWCYASVSMFDHPEHGRVWVVVHTDITERKRAEEELRESEERYRDLFENANDLIQSVDANGKFVYVNRKWKQVMGYSDEEIKKLNLTDILRIDQVPHCMDLFKKVVSSETLDNVDTVFITKEGKEIFVSGSVNPKIKDGKFVATRGIFRNVTERRKLQQQLIQSEKLVAVGTLAYGIAHEFNNILAGILANAELGLFIRDSKQKKKCFESIVECSYRASSITSNLLPFTQQKDVKKELNDITEPLKSVLSLVHRELEKANIKIVEKFKPIPKIFCDQGQFSEVFLNMLTNARDAMRPKGGTLTVKVEPYKDDIRIVFKDTGCGIPENIKGKIFDPFVTTKGPLGGSDIPGTGLGLFLTHGIIDSYKGKIEVESREGVGTKFTILIPVSKNLPRKSLLETEIKSTKEIKRKLNILLVDDERPICITLKKFLESKGHKVTTSLRAKEGLGLFKKNKFDIVLSDITIPDMDGIELIKKMKKEDEKSKIIVLTGHIARELQKKAKEAGANEVLIKPFKNQTLYQTISELVFK